MAEPNRFIWPFRIALGLYVFAAAGLVAGAIAISTKEVPVSAYVQTAPTLRVDQPNAARGVVLDGETGRYLVGAKVEISKDKATFAEGKSAPHGHVHLNITPSKAQSGDVSFVARHGRLDEPYELSAKLKVSDAETPSWPTPTPRTTEPWEPHYEPWTGSIRVDPFPTTDIVRGLPDVVLLRMTDKESGAPVRGEIRLTKVEGMVEGELGKRHVSDALGFVRIDLTAMTRQLWTLEARKADEPLAEPSIGKVGFDTAPAQYSLHLLKPYVAPGEAIEGAVHSLHRSGGLMVDLYDPDDWVAADAFGLDKERSGIRVVVPEIPGPPPPYYRVQVYGNIFGVETAWDADYVAAAPEPGLTGCRIALERVLDELAVNDPDLWKKWVEGAREQLREIRTQKACYRTLDSVLLAIPRHFSRPNLLINSQQTEREELERWKDEVRSDLVLLLAFVLTGGLLFVVFLVLRGLAENRRQKAAFDAVSLEFDEEEADELSRYEEYLDYARIAVILISLVSFVLSLIMLMGYL